MPAHINHNAHLKLLHYNLGTHSAGAARQIAQLSSGNRVNRSSDDPASMALANGIQSETRALAEGGRNAQQMIHMLQVAEGSLNTMSEVVRRMQGLAAQAASDTYQHRDRHSIDVEFQQLGEEIDRIAQFTTYNGIPLLSEDREFTIQTGPSETSSDVGQILLHDMRASSRRLSIGTLSLGTRADAIHAMDQLQVATEAIADERNQVAAFHHRLELNATTTGNILTRMQTAESRIRSADVAASVAELTANQMLSQTAISVAMKADADTNRILMLLRR